MMNKTLLPYFCILFSDSVLLSPFNGSAQFNVNYNDVGVIYNINDAGSQTIANYFMAKRNIPFVNLIPVDVPVTEEINDSVFQSYASQVQNYLITNYLDTVLNYLVTTKGCPLKVLRASPDTNNCNSSCESDLMLIPPAHHPYFGGCSSIAQLNSGQYLVNPYLNAAANFTRAQYGIYLVTRLDAYTVQEVLSMIDRNGPNTYVNKDSALFVFDQSPNWAGNSLNNAFVTASNLLVARGWHTVLNTDSFFVTNQKNVLGYASWGSNDGFSNYYTQNAIPHNTWLNGSIAETCVSTSARSFQSNTSYGQSLIADLLDEGSTSAKGYVYEPYTIAIANAYYLFGRYTNLLNDGTPRYNLAESYFGASRMISWMDVVIGDPKTSITTNLFLANNTAEKESYSFSVYPNPSTGTLYFQSPPEGSGHLQLMDVLGHIKYSTTYMQGFLLQINTDSWPKGVYLLQVKIDSSTISKADMYYTKTIVIL